MMRRIACNELSCEPTPLVQSRDVLALECALSGQAMHAQALARAELDIVEVTQRAVACVLQAELTLAPEHIRTIVQSQLQAVRAARAIEVQVHPADRALLPREDELAASIETQGALTIREDPTLSRGDCVVISNLGEIDGRLTTKLAQLKRILAQRTQP